MNYTIDDVRKKISDNGLYMSESDWKIAEKNPDAAMSIVQYKIDFDSAPTAEARALANAGAESIRKKFGYTGGSDGSGFYQYEGIADYKDPYAEKKSALMNEIADSKFEYNPDTDPVARAYQKSYAREGNRATSDTLAKVSAVTGGNPSSYAVSAANQAANTYAAASADKIPELASAAENRFNNDMTRKRQLLDIYKDASDRDYSRELTADELKRQKEQTEYERAQTAQKNALDNAMRAADIGDYSQLQALGYDTSTAEKRAALTDLYTRGQLATQAASLGDFDTVDSYGFNSSNLRNDKKNDNALTDVQLGNYAKSVTDSDYRNQIELAQLYATYGDFSLLKALGVDTTAAEAAYKNANTPQTDNTTVTAAIISALQAYKNKKATTEQIDLLVDAGLIDNLGKQITEPEPLTYTDAELLIAKNNYNIGKATLRDYEILLNEGIIDPIERKTQPSDTDVNDIEGVTKPYGRTAFYNLRHQGDETLKMFATYEDYERAFRQYLAETGGTQ